MRVLTESEVNSLRGANNLTNCDLWYAKNTNQIIKCDEIECEYISGSYNWVRLKNGYGIPEILNHEKYFPLDALLTLDEVLLYTDFDQRKYSLYYQDGYFLIVSRESFISSLNQRHGGFWIFNNSEKIDQLKEISRICKLNGWINNEVSI